MTSTPSGIRLSSCAAQLPASATAALDAHAKQLIAEGVDVVNLTSGEPDFPTVGPAAQAAIRAIEDGFTRYTPAAGIPELRGAVAAYLNRHGTTYEPADVVVTAGAKQALHHAFTVLLEKGDEVLVPAPYWVSYPHLITLAGGVPVAVHAGAGDGGKLTPARLRKALTDRTRAVVLNSPANPSGSLYSRAELGELAAVAAEADLTIVSDEICDHWVYGSAFSSVAALGDDIAARTVTVGGVSKTFAMTGWRIGWAAAPRPVAAALTAVQSHASSAPSSISQKAALGALSADLTAELAHRRAALDERRQAVLQAMAGIPLLRLDNDPGGAFFVFADVSASYGLRRGNRTISSGADFAELLLQQARVAVVPGADFGAPDHVRISYTISPERLREAMERLARFSASLVPA